MVNLTYSIGTNYCEYAGLSTDEKPTEGVGIGSKFTEVDTGGIEFLYSGSGWVKRKSGGGSMNLQTKTVMPSTADQDITPDDGYDGLSEVTVYGSANLVPGNIKKDVDIFGVVGTFNGGGTTVELSDVNFFDYDGTLVDSYTAEEFAALSALPANPSHEGLTAQGWNWSLSDAKTYVASYGKLQVGQTYTTDDGKTRAYIKLDGGALSPTLRLAVDGSAVIDWGDESATDTLTGSDTTAVLTVQHTYAVPGDYVISIDVTGNAAIIGSMSGSYMNYTYSTLLSSTYESTITKIEIGSNISIGERAFNYCSSLSSVTIPDSVTSIGNNAFQNCYALSSVTIPDSVTTIGSNAFNNCYALSSVTIPDGVTSINYSAFQNCYALSSVTIPDSVNFIGNNAFQSCFALSSLTIADHDGIYSIEQSAFSACYALSSVTIPDSAPYIGNSVFQNCYALSLVVIPDSVTSIGNSAFQNCYALSSVTIPDSVTSIGNNAFKNMTNAESYHIKPTTPPTLGTDAFSGISATCTIYVPSASLETYKAASNWSTYASQMVGE